MEDERLKRNEPAYWFVAVVPSAGALVAGGVSGGEVWSSGSAQPISIVETAAIKNNSFFIRIP